MAQQRIYGQTRVTVGRAGVVLRALDRKGDAALIRISEPDDVVALGSALGSFGTEHQINEADPLSPSWHREVSGLKIGSRLDEGSQCQAVIGLRDGSVHQIAPADMEKIGVLVAATPLIAG